VIYLFDVLEEGRALSAEELLLRQECRDRLAVSLRERAAFWKQHGKQRTIHEGDTNTAFHHAHASCRMRRNQIRTLEVEGDLLTSHDDNTTALTAHLRALLGAAAPVDHLDVRALYAEAPRLGSENRERLVAPFTELEARSAVKAMNRNNSPGPDGFGPGLYTAAWTTVSAAVMDLAREFHRGIVDLERLNSSYIVMIPKSAVARRPGDFRPICLQNCSLKITSKMLTTRLQTEISKLIDVD
jgi:hypothetical protein